MTRHLAKILLCIVLLAASGITFGRAYMMPHRPHHATPTFSRPRPPVVHHRPLMHHSRPHHPPSWPYWMTFMGMQHFRPASPPPPLPFVYARPPQQIWVAGHYEDQVTVVNGVRVVQRVWIPGQWVTVP